MGMLKFMAFMIFLLGVSMIGVGGWANMCGSLSAQTHWGWFFAVGVVFVLVSACMVGEVAKNEKK